MKNKGILMSISSLPVPKGIGSLGISAYKFIDVLSECGYKYWQVLPLNQTGFWDSPYQSFSAHSGNPYFIDLDMLVEEGYIDTYFENFTSQKVDYGRLYKIRYRTLRTIKLDRVDNVELGKFCDDNEWIYDYSLFMAMKMHYNGASWDYWDEDIRRREPHAMATYEAKYTDEIKFWQVLQYLFYKQWAKLKSYARDKSVEIIGDMPIYVAYDSADVWANPGNYKLDANLHMTEVAGVPPDYFSETGQLWGNPIYNWDRMGQDNYSWWIGRMRHAMKLYDVVRIDHFRGFAGYYSVPISEKTAINGKWNKGVGLKFFNAVMSAVPDCKIIAEDLGVITEDVKELIIDTGFPGMKVLQFMLGDCNNTYIPYNYTTSNCVVYTATHDNMTTKQWYSKLNSQDKTQLRKLLRKYSGCVSHRLINLALDSIADTVIVPVQDILNIGASGRMNVPSVGKGNWRYRITEKNLLELSNIIKSIEKGDSMEIVKLKPAIKEYIWGGDKLEKFYSKEKGHDKIAETWELSLHKDGLTIIDSGKDKGKTLIEVVQQGDPCETVGYNTTMLAEYKKDTSFFPQLIKFIDAKDNLSIQVHPNDEYANKYENGQMGKTEVWYVMEAEQGAGVYFGFKNKITEQEMAQAIQDNTILDYLNFVEAQKGDVFFIEAGTVHAICKGLTLAEIQENSNLTYRVYDYNRVDAEGNYRQLHVDKALKVSSTCPPKIQKLKEEKNGERVIAKNKFFTVIEYVGQDETVLKTKMSFNAIMIIEGTGKIHNDSISLDYKKGDTFFVPANNGEYTVKMDTKTTFLKSEVE